MSATLSKIEKKTAYTLLLPAVCLVFAIILFPIFANVWISFKEVGLKDIRIPEPRAKKIVKNIKNKNSELKISDNKLIYTSGSGGIFKAGIPIGKLNVENKVEFLSDLSQLTFVKLVSFEKEK